MRRTLPLLALLALFSSFALSTPRATDARVPAVLTRLLPLAVSPPHPAWLMIFLHSPRGGVMRGVKVNATVVFQRRTVHLHAKTGTDGVAAIMIDTSHAYHRQKVKIHVAARVGGKTVSSAASLRLGTREGPAKHPSATPTSTPTATATETPQPPPTATDIPLDTPTDTPIPTDTPVDTPVEQPTSTDVPPSPTDTPTDIVMPTDIPTATDVPTSTDTPVPTSTSTPVPTATPSPTAGTCAGTSCLQFTVDVLNQDRAQYGAQPLSLDLLQSTGNGSCRGALGHSEDMAAAGQIGHDNLYSEFCVGHGYMGQNVGQWGNADEAYAINGLNGLMMSEPHDAQTCAIVVNHACNILNPNFNAVGVGIFVDSSGTLWLTEDFESNP